MSTQGEKSIVIGGRTISLEDVRKQILEFGNEITKYLERVGANVEVYKFSIEKKPEGAFEVEVHFKALIHQKSESSKIIPR